MIRPKLRLATCCNLPEVDVDHNALEAALHDADIDFHWLAWDDRNADWDAPIPTVIRTTWNYVHAATAFAAWATRVAAVAPLWNPAHVVTATMHKKYLLHLAQLGVATVPSVVVAQNHAMPADPFVAQRIVIKPAVGAGSFGTRWFERHDIDAARAHGAELLQTSDLLIQPYVASVESYGERSLVFLDGQLSHAIRKSPRFSGDHERIEGPLPVAGSERELAMAALAAYDADLAYGRVDMALDDHGQPMVMELELIEPSLFFGKQPGSAERFAHGLRRRLLALG
jgi:hypothetical protein